MAYLIKATEEHARALASVLCPADRAEVEALTGREPLDLLLWHAAKPDAWAMFSDVGELAGMCGVDPIYPPTPDYPGILKTGTPKLGQPWIVAGDVLTIHEFLPLNCCRFCGHEDKIVTKDLESGYDEAEVQPRVQSRGRQACDGSGCGGGAGGP